MPPLTEKDLANIKKGIEMNKAQQVTKAIPNKGFSDKLKLKSFEIPYWA